MGWSSGRNIAMLGLVGAGITLMLGLSWAPSVSISAFKAPEAQRIFYWHVPSAWAAMIAFTMLFVGSTFWFFKRSEWAWRLHVASSEAGLATGLMCVFSGCVWGLLNGVFLGIGPTYDSIHLQYLPYFRCIWYWVGNLNQMVWKPEIPSQRLECMDLFLFQ